MFGLWQKAERFRCEVSLDRNSKHKSKKKKMTRIRSFQMKLYLIR